MQTVNGQRVASASHRGHRASGFRDGIFDHQLKAFFSVPVIPLGPIGYFFKSTGLQWAAGDIELNSRVCPSISRTVSQDHPAVAVADRFAGVDPNAGIHEQRVGVALAERSQAVQVVHQFRSHLVQGNAGVNGQYRFNRLIRHHPAHHGFQAVSERSDIAGWNRQPRGEGMPAERVKKIAASRQGR
jgi:hypothetical protein